MRAYQLARELSVRLDAGGVDESHAKFVAKLTALGVLVGAQGGIDPETVMRLRVLAGLVKDPSWWTAPLTIADLPKLRAAGMEIVGPTAVAALADLGAMYRLGCAADDPRWWGEMLAVAGRSGLLAGNDDLAKLRVRGFAVEDERWWTAVLAVTDLSRFRGRMWAGLPGRFSHVRSDDEAIEERWWAAFVAGDPRYRRASSSPMPSRDTPFSS